MQLGTPHSYNTAAVSVLYKDGATRERRDRLHTYQLEERGSVGGERKVERKIFISGEGLKGKRGVNKGTK